MSERKGPFRNLPMIVVVIMNFASGVKNMAGEEIFCSECGVEFEEDFTTCPECGAIAPVTTMEEDVDLRQRGAANPNMNLAVAGLLLNMLVFPGLGSIIGGAKEGWFQASLAGILIILRFVANVPNSLYIEGVFLFFVFTFIVFILVWGWGVWTGVSMIRRANHYNRQKTSYESFGR